jgi:galactoside O-acetyltransferase
MSAAACPREFRSGQRLSEDTLRHWLGTCGKRVTVYQGCRIFPPERVSVGDYSQIDEGVWIYAGQGVRIGAHVHLALGCSISGGGECVIEDFAGLGVGVRLITGTEDVHSGPLTNPTIPSQFRGVSRGKIVVGAHALIFTHSVIFMGVTIGEGAVVAAGSLVHHNLKPWGIYAGNPLVQVGLRPAEPVLQAARELRSREGA